MKKEDIIILGAGPGGIATALKLDKLGIKCTVLDKAVFPRDKVCGDGISGKVTYAYKQIDPTIFDDFKQRHDLKLNCWGVQFILPKERTMTITIPTSLKTIDFEAHEKAEAFISKRMDFDNFLVEKAKEAPNVTLLEGVDIQDFEELADGFLLKNKQGETLYECRLLIAADGALSKFAKQFGHIHKENEHHVGAIRAYYTGLKNEDGHNFLELHYLKEFFPGYLWIFPLPNGGANVGAGMRTDKISEKRVNLKTELDRILREHPRFKDRFKEAKVDGKVVGFPLPLGSKKRKISGKNFILIGDAASLIDPLTGEGIGNATISGIFAAEQAEKCLIANDFSAEMMANYDEVVYDKLWKELQISYRLQKAFQRRWLLSAVSGIAVKNKQLAEVITAIFANVDLKKMFKNPLFIFKVIFNR
jgi:geranylgeranyl reductase family protein